MTDNYRTRKIDARAMKGNMRLDLDRIQYILLRTSVDILEDKKGGTPIIYNQECKGMP